MKPKYLNIKDNTAYIRNVNLLDVAKEFNTPLYVFVQYVLDDIMILFKDNF